MAKKQLSNYSAWNGSKLRSLRELLGFTQVKFAGELGISHRMYCYYETGERQIPKSVELAARWLGLLKA